MRKLASNSSNVFDDENQDYLEAMQHVVLSAFTEARDIIESYDNPTMHHRTSRGPLDRP